MFFRWTVLYSGNGYCWVKGEPPNQISFQKWTVERTIPKLEKKRSEKIYFLTLVRPFQKGELVGFSSTWWFFFQCICYATIVATLPLPWVAWITIYRANIYSLILNLLYNPPWSLGRQAIFHIVNLYLFFLSSVRVHALPYSFQNFM
jgi:hypothetical protein